jgi:hypothetical protein
VVDGFKVVQVKAVSTFAAATEIARNTQNRRQARVARGLQKRQRPTESGQAFGIGGAQARPG